MDRMNGKPLEDKLDALWAEYRAAFPDPESDANFMPMLWQKIESRRFDSTPIFRRCC